MNEKTRIRIILLLLILITAGVYYNSLNAPFILDDNGKIVKNPDIKKLSDINSKLIYPYNKVNKTFFRNDPSRPLVYLTFALNYHFGKLNTFGYHLVNVIIHVLNVILVFFLTKNIILYAHVKQSHAISFFTALFFAVHPVNSIVTSYTFNRTVSLSALFYMLSLLFFIKAFENNRFIYAVSLLCFVLALFSRQDAVTLPVILLVFDYLFISSFNLNEVIRKKFYHLPFWGILAGYLLFRYAYFGGIGDIEAATPLNRHSYFITQPYIILRYLKLLLFPSGACFMHSIVPERTIVSLKVIAPFIINAAIVISALVLCFKKKNEARIFIFSVLWFFITIAPTSSIFPTTAAMADNRIYVPGIGILLVLVIMYFEVFKYFISKLPGMGRQWILYSIMGVHIFYFSISTFERNFLFQNPLQLWEDVVKKYPDAYNSVVYIGIGNGYYGAGRYKKALEAYKKALELHPDNNLAHTNIGKIYHDIKEYEAALREYSIAVESDPDCADTHYNMGKLYQEKKDFTRAINEYKSTIDIDPYFTDAYYNLGILYYSQKEYDKAARNYLRAIDIEPGYFRAYYNLGFLYQQQGLFNKAFSAYRKALKINPNYAKAHYKLSGIYYKQKKFAKALEELGAAAKLDKGNSQLEDRIREVRKMLQE